MTPTRIITTPELLTMLGSLRHRAEKADDLDAYAPSFVPVINQSLLSNRNTQVIYGRNGTGKTHILRCFEELTINSIDHHRILPVYFDMRELDLSRIAPDVSPEKVVHLFFSSFMHTCVTRMEKTINSLAQDAHSARGSFFTSQAKQSKARAAFKRLKRAFDNTQMRENIDAYTKSIRTSTSQKSSLDGTLGISSDALKAEVGASRGRVHSREEFTEMVIKASHFIDFQEVRLGLSDLTAALDIRHITFLIDEWSQLDTSFQPIFSELIRRTIGTCNCVSVKIAALKFLTRFTEHVGEKRIGLQPGVDITELTDLNHIFTFDLDRTAVRSFLMYILIKHLIEEILITIYNYDFQSRNNPVYAHVQQIFDLLFGSIFESREAFDYFVRASEGNPRDFLAMIAECCATHGAANLPIPLKAVQASAISYFTNSKMGNFNGGADAKSVELFNGIFQKTLGNRSKIFSVSKDVDRDSLSLRDLWAQRIIHLIDNDYEYFDVGSGEVNEFVLYAVDYGKILAVRSDVAGGEALKGIVDTTRQLVDGLYDGISHKAILEHIEKEDSNLAKVSEIMGMVPDPSAVMEQVVALSPEQLFDKVREINVDDLVRRYP